MDIILSGNFEELNEMIGGFHSNLQFLRSDENSKQKDLVFSMIIETIDRQRVLSAKVRLNFEQVLEVSRKFTNAVVDICLSKARKPSENCLNYFDMLLKKTISFNNEEINSNSNHYSDDVTSFDPDLFFEYDRNSMINNPISQRGISSDNEFRLIFTTLLHKKLDYVVENYDRILESQPKTSEGESNTQLLEELGKSFHEFDILKSLYFELNPESESVSEALKTDPRYQNELKMISNLEKIICLVARERHPHMNGKKDQATQTNFILDDINQSLNKDTHNNVV